MKNSKQFIDAAEFYFSRLNEVCKSGEATPERSLCTPLASLLNAIGAALNPKVICAEGLTDLGAGHPDFGLFTGQQFHNGEVRVGQVPGGVVELIPVDDEAFITETNSQTSQYWNRCRLVLATNLRDFVLLGEDSAGNPVRLETLRLAGCKEEFLKKLDNPHAFANEVGERMGEYLSRALSYRRTLTEPKDVAWILASYARDTLSRILAAGETPFFLSVRKELEKILGIRFEGDKGHRFFCSTLVQTLFYGLFSAWVLWSRGINNEDDPIFERISVEDHFNWKEADCYLKAPVLRALFRQVSRSERLQTLDLIEVLDWAANALDRIERTEFFSKFDQSAAVQYFYEPFLKEFDPELRKQLGVWYTPAEVVRYMVSRVDLALKKELDIPDGLAAENVYVLDPCCGTGAYLAEVLRRISQNLTEQGLGALAGSRIKRAICERIFGFEIMPAPFAVAHLQISLTAQELGVHFADDEAKSGIFLTNALTGWESSTSELIQFPELQEERDRAEQVKQNAPIVVVFGNPPYNGFAGVAIHEERMLSDAHKATRKVQIPKGKGLNDLYVRFFRMADRRIEKTGQGIVCFISNYSWLDGLSFTGMREHFLDAFDLIQIDCLNGDRYKTGKTAPDGSPDPSIFSTEQDSVGIQVGTAITTLIRKSNHSATDCIHFRHLWGTAKREELITTAEKETAKLYERIKPKLQHGLPFVQMKVSDKWFDWPSLPELFPTSFSGVSTGRDSFLVDIDIERLRRRISDYFDTNLSNNEIAKRYPVVMKTLTHFDGNEVRDAAKLGGGSAESGFIRYSYRPFDNRWLYWEQDYDLLHRPRPEYKPHVFAGNIWLTAAEHIRKGGDEPQANFTTHIGSSHLIERGAKMIPAWLIDNGFWNDGDETQRHPNLSCDAQKYLKLNNLGVEDLFYHSLAVLHDPDYRNSNSGALCIGWPRIPLPNWPKKMSNSDREDFVTSVSIGRKLACLLNPDSQVPGVTAGRLRSGLNRIAVPSTKSGQNMTGQDFLLSSRWGFFGSDGAVMPGSGNTVKRQYSSLEECNSREALLKLGETTVDVYINDNVFWQNVPINVWEYRLGGYQVLKKWLSYREHTVIGRALLPEEIEYFLDVARRIATILLEIY